MEYAKSALYNMLLLGNPDKRNVSYDWHGILQMASCVYYALEFFSCLFLPSEYIPR